MKISLIQRQLKLNAQNIKRMEESIWYDKRDIYLTNKAIMLDGTVSERYRSSLVVEKEKMFKEMTATRKKLASLVELQKALKKDLRLYYSSQRKLKYYAQLLGKAKTPTNIDYYEKLVDKMFGILEAFK